ncbi:MAG: PAS domain S-box protein [Spirochaetota bacterium]|nr:PAS domain S-box protein [Spirochaetota bacterium]
MKEIADNSIKVLIVDDSITSIEFYKYMLSKSTTTLFQTESVASLFDSLNILDNNHYDVILLDLNLTDSMNLNTLLKIKEKSSHLPIIVITGEHEDDLGAEAIANGAQDYLIKGKHDIYLLEKSIKYAIERKKIEDNLRWKEVTIRVLLNAPTESMSLLDLHGNIIEMNRTAAIKLGKDVDEMIGKCIWDFFPSNLAELRKKLTSEVIETKKSVHYLDERSGFIFENSLYPVFDEQRRVTQIATFSKDITARRRAEESLKKSEEQFRMMIENGSDIISLLDDEGIILYESPSIDRLLGYNPIDIIGMKFLDFIHPDDLEILTNTLNELLHNGVESKSDTPLLRVNRFHHKNGSWRILESIFNPYIDNKNRVSCLIVNSRDITDRKRIEAELLKHKEHLEELVEERTIELIKAKDLAESANRAKSEFLSTMSHELRTPLNSILGFSKLMIMGYDEETYNTHANNILSSGKRLLNTINDILEYTSIDAGRIELNRGFIHLQDILSRCVSSFSYEADSKEISIENRVSDGKPLRILGDRDKIEQVFRILLSNAIKYSATGEKIKILSHVQNNHIEIDIIDRGIGIRKEDQDLIFRDFTQVESGLTRETEGAGLGLTIAQGIIKAHKGTISLKSEVGKGSIFTVRLPLAIYSKPATIDNFNSKVRLE